MALRQEKREDELFIEKKEEKQNIRFGSILTWGLQMGALQILSTRDSGVVKENDGRRKGVVNKREVRIDSGLRTMHKTKRVERECDIRDMYARVVTTQHVYTKHLSDGCVRGIY